MKKKLLKKSGIYLVTDEKALKGKPLLPIISSALDGGVDIIQLRVKNTPFKEALDIGRAIKNLLKGREALFIVNDDIDLAVSLDSDGIHLGQNDTPPEAVREALGRKKIIGLSTHSMAEAREAVKKDIDYISIGPVFPTPTKPDYKAVGLEAVKNVSKEINIPFVAIGGIDESNIKEVVAAGAKRVAVVRAILSSDEPFLATRSLLRGFASKEVDVGEV